MEPKPPSTSLWIRIPFFSFFGLAALLLAVFLIYGTTIVKSAPLDPNPLTDQVKPIVTGPRNDHYDVYVTPEQYRIYFLLLKGTGISWVLWFLTYVWMRLDQRRQRPTP